MDRYIRRKNIFLLIITILITVALYYLSDRLLISTFQTREHNFPNEEIRLSEVIRSGLLEGRQIINLGNRRVKSEDVFRILFDVLYDEPEILYFTESEHKKGRLIVKYSHTKAKIKKDQISLKLKKNEIIRSLIDESMTEFEKVIAVHDYIILNSTYDMNLLSGGEYEDESYTAYGNLVLGVSVCEGYAKAFKYILDELEIENQIVVGYTNDHKHAWNLVKLDEEYYHVDLTWDDPITTECEGFLHYTYFNLADNQISKTHFWDREKYPKANGEYYNYFNYYDLIISDEDEFKKEIKNALLTKCNKLLLKYENYWSNNVSLDSIIEDIKSNYNNLIDLKSYDYCIDKCQGIFNIYFYYNK